MKAPFVIALFCIGFLLGITTAQGVLRRTPLRLVFSDGHEQVCGYVMYTCTPDELNAPGITEFKVDKPPKKSP